MLTMSVPDAFRDDRLAQIELVDNTAHTVGDLDPAINLLGISVFGLE
jgi:hypothetical protein